MDQQAMLGVLMNMTEEQQQAIDKLLKELKNQSEAMQGAVQAVKKAAVTIERAGSSASMEIQRATRGAVIDSFADVSSTAVKALERAAGPFLDRMSRVAVVTGEAETQLRLAIMDFSWRWRSYAGLAIAGSATAVLLVGWLTTWWLRSEVQGLRDQRREIAAEVVELKANAENWERRAGRAKLVDCDGKGHLCVRVYDNVQYMVNNEDGYYMIRY